MSIRHSILPGGVIVTFISRPVKLDDVFKTLEALAPFAHEDVAWCQVIVLGQNTLASLPFVDVLTLAEWVSEIGSGFSTCSIALCAATDADFSAARDLAKLVAQETVSVAVFRELLEAKTWGPPVKSPEPTIARFWQRANNGALELFIPRSQGS